MFIPFSRINIPQGITSVIGSGGKSTFLRFLSETLPGTVILTTSTHMFPFPQIPLLDTAGCKDVAECAGQAEALLSKHRVLCIGSLSPESGKLCAPPADPAVLSSLAAYVIVEADGSRGYPLKAHRPFEPVIWQQSALTICLAGASGIGKPAAKVCHCPELFCEKAGVLADSPLFPEQIARVLNSEDLADCYLINQTDVLDSPAAAAALCTEIKKPAAAGSLLQRRFLQRSPCR